MGERRTDRERGIERGYRERDMVREEYRDAVLVCCIV